MIPEYLPWSKQVFKECLIRQSEGFLPTLDLEFTAKCSGCSCIYCDSKPEVSNIIDYQETSKGVILKFLEETLSLGLKWVYACGLGEPLEDPKFWDILYFLTKHGIKLSMFSNGVFIRDSSIARELKKNDVNIILKMDTFDEEKFDTILGIKGAAKRIYTARDHLLSAGYAQDELLTDLAFSIVPTSLSIPDIPEVIEFCKKHKIFASIGELEQAGEVISKNLSSTLSVSKDDTDRLKQIANEYFGSCYMRPICPCILTGLHIDNRGDCIVDRVTGLNCKWFLLTEPDIKVIGNICDTSASVLFEKTKNHRADAFIKNKTLIDSSFNVSYAFGGCGGNPCEIIKLATEGQMNN